MRRRSRLKTKRRDGRVQARRTSGDGVGVKTYLSCSKGYGQATKLLVEWDDGQYAEKELQQNVSEEAKSNKIYKVE